MVRNTHDVLAHVLWLVLWWLKAALALTQLAPMYHVRKQLHSAHCAYTVTTQGHPKRFLRS
jgi:hypothetical protein